MKKSIAIVCAILIAATTALTGCQSGSSGSSSSPSNSSSQPSEDFGKNPSGTIVEWSQSEKILKINEETVPKKFPNLKFKYVLVNNNDYIQKLQVAISSKLDVPDILAGEVSFRGQLFSMDISENLEAAPYKFDRKELLDAVVPGLLNSRGELVGLDNQFCPTGFAYRRDLTEKYFGVSEPEDVQKLVKDWNTFIETGKQLEQKSGGKVSMMSGMNDLIDVLQGQAPNDIVDGNKLNITDHFKKIFDKANQIKKSGVRLASNQKDSTAWMASWVNGTVMFQNFATWATNYAIISNDKDGATKGKWGFCLAPEQTWLNGGTSVGIYKDSKNKEGAWAFLKYCRSTNEGYLSAYQGLGWMGSFKSFYEGDDSPLKKPFIFAEWFNGQNYGKYLYDNMGTNITPYSTPSPYLDKIRLVVKDASNKLMMDSNMTSDQATEYMVSNLKLNLPSAQIS